MDESINDDFVLSDVGNEVSIIDDDQNKIQNLIQNRQNYVQTSVLIIKSGNIRNDVSNNVSTNQNQEKQLMAILPTSPKQIKSSAPTTNITIRPKTNTTPISITSPIANQTQNSKPQYQIIRLVSASTNNTSSTNSTSTTTFKQLTPAISGQQRLLIPASALKGTNINLNTSQILATTGSGGQQQLLMYTPQTVKQTSNTSTPKAITFSTSNVQPLAGGISTSNLHQRSNYVPILPNPSTIVTSLPNKATGISTITVQKNLQNGSKIGEEIIQIPATSTITSAPSSNRPRKPCNCTRSQCLKLYCDCFANGEFCSNCNCINCFNNLDHEENRQKAIKQCLERNPHAFHPKIGKGKTTAQEGIERRHTKGCNCRRSGCLKNYCECYEAKILCTDLCKCCACKNYEDSYERKSLMHLVDSADILSSHLHGGSSGSNFIGKENDPLWGNEFRSKLPVPFISEKLLSCSLINNDILDATCQCLVARAEKAQKSSLSPEDVERSILEEFGRCLEQIIDLANKEKQKDK